MEADRTLMEFLKLCDVLGASRLIDNGGSGARRNKFGARTRV
jgi:hypothetical protein